MAHCECRTDRIPYSANSYKMKRVRRNPRVVGFVSATDGLAIAGTAEIIADQKENRASLPRLLEGSSCEWALLIGLRIWTEIMAHGRVVIPVQLHEGRADAVDRPFFSKILEIQAQGKLHLPRRRGGGDDAKLRGIDDVCRAHVPYYAGQVEIHVIEGVVGISPELELHVLSNREVLGNSQVQIGVARAPQIITGAGLQPERAAVGKQSPRRVREQLH